MFGQILFVLFSLLLVTNDHRAGQNAEVGGALARGGFSFIELDAVTGSPDNESTGYMDTSLNNRVEISKRQFKNGLLLVNFMQPFEGEYQDFRVIINGGSSSDPINLPGIRYMALFLLGKQVERCMKQIFKEEATGIYTKVKVNTSTSYIFFTFLTRQTGKFMKCFVNAVENHDFLDKGSYFVETLQLSEKFERTLLEPESIEVDKLAIRDLYSSVPVFGGPSLLVSDIFSETCYKNSVNFNKILPSISHQLLTEMFMPHKFSIIFIGRERTSSISKMLSSLAKGKLRSETKIEGPLDMSLAERATKAIKNLDSSVIVRNDLSSNILRIYVPFITDDIRSMASNAHLFVMSVLSSKHRRGIYNFLFMNEFTTKATVNFYTEYNNIMVYLELYLSKTGKSHVPVIIDSVISYFNLLKKTVMSDRIFSEVQRIFDEQLSTSTVAFAETAEHYISSHFALSKSPENILSSGMNTQFSRSDVEHFLSKMSLESAVVSLTIPDQDDINTILFNKRGAGDVFAVNAVESHSNVRFKVFKIRDVFSKDLHSLEPVYADEVFGLRLPNSELISSICLPSFVSKPILDKMVPLHNSLDIHNKYLEDTCKRVTISRTMAFKSLTTTKIWFSNSDRYGKNVKLQLKLSMREWSPLIEEYSGQISSFSVLVAMHTMTALLNMKINESLSYTNRLGANVEFVPSQSFYDAISDPFEIYLVVVSPTNYLSLIMSEVSSLLTSFDATSFDRNTLSIARRFAKDTLLRLYTGYNHFDKDIKVITQIVSSQHCSFVRLGKALEQETDAKFVQAVYSSLMLSPSIYGLIEGNLTPFHANHLLNVFVESLDHKFFMKEVTFENSMEFFNPVSYVPEQPLADGAAALPPLEMGTYILDVSTVPARYNRLFTKKLDFTATSSCSTISILVGRMSVQNYSNATLMKEAIMYELSNSGSFTGDVVLTSSISFIANRFIVILISVESNEITTGSLAKILDESFTQSISRIVQSYESKSYLKKALEHTDLRTPLSDQRILMSKFEQFDLMSKCRSYFHSLKKSDVTKVLSMLEVLPRIFIVTQKVSNVKASISSFDYMPKGYLDIGSNYKLLLEEDGVQFEYF